MAGDWRFLAFDLRTQVFLTELEVADWQSTEPLVGAGSWSATLRLDGAAKTSTTLRRTTVADATRRGRTLVVAERDGAPVYTGILWDRRYSARDRLLRVAGAGLKSYFDHFPVTAPLGPYTAVDQFSIFRAFVTAVQSAPAGDIGIVVDAQNSGVLRDRPLYPAFSGKTLGELMADLASVQNGFEWTVAVEYNAGVPERRLRLFYPRRGRDQTLTGLRFDAPGNAILFDVDEPGHDMAVTVVALGAGDGADMLLTTASRTDLIDAGWPGYAAIRSWKDVTVLTTLASHAGAAVDRLSGVDQEDFTVQVDPTSVGQPFGAWTLGDDCVLGVADDPFYPAQDDGTPGLVSYRRVVQHSWKVTASSEELMVTLGRKVIP